MTYLQRNPTDPLITELPALSDRSAAELLELLQALFASLDSRYYAQVARYRRRQRMPPWASGPDALEPEDPF